MIFMKIVFQNFCRKTISDADMSFMKASDSETRIKVEWRSSSTVYTILLLFFLPSTR